MSYNHVNLPPNVGHEHIRSCAVQLCFLIAHCLVLVFLRSCSWRDAVTVIARWHDNMTYWMLSFFMCSQSEIPARRLKRRGSSSYLPPPGTTAVSLPPWSSIFFFFFFSSRRLYVPPLRASPTFKDCWTFHNRWDETAVCRKMCLAKEYLHSFA